MNRTGDVNLETTYRWRKLLIDSGDVLDVNLPSSKRRPVVATVRTSTQSYTTMASRHHRASDKMVDRLISRDTAHQLRRDCLVASFKMISTATIIFAFV